MRKALKDKRLELGLSQSEVARKAQITRQYYNYIEANERNPSIEVLKKIAKVLNITDLNYF